MSELKLCPFCGCGDIGMSSDLSGEWAHCFCQAMDGRSVHKEQWNRRPLEEALEARVKELEGNVSEWERDWAEENAESTARLNRARNLEARVKELELEIAAADHLDAEAAIGANELMAENKRLEVELNATKANMDSNHNFYERDRRAWIDSKAYSSQLIRERDNDIVRLKAELALAQAAAVRWVTYTGEPETLPKIGALVILRSKGFMEAYLKATAWQSPGGAPPSLDGYAISKLLRDSDGGEGKWIAEGTLGWEVLPLYTGDRWAYLPIPPEASK